MPNAAPRDIARHRAALIHLGASILLVGGALLVPLWFWYPGALRPLAGVDRYLVQLFAAVLLVGPALTWLVYRTGKRTLRMDITVVVVIQLLFLCYATTMLTRLRPVFLVATAQSLQLVRAIDIDPQDLSNALEEMRALSWTGPREVGVVPPGFVLFGADEYPRRPAYYLAYDHVAPQLLQGAKATDAVISRSSADAAAIRPTLAALGRDADSTRVVAIDSLAGSAAMLIDASTGRPLRAIDVTF